MAADAQLLSLEGLGREFSVRRGLAVRRFLAVDGATLSLPSSPHEILALAGESGSGKTTLARLILGVMAPTSGRILFKGRDVRLLEGRDQRSWFRREVQPVFQDPYATFNPLRTVDSYLRATARNFGVAARSERDARIDDALQAVGMGLRDVRGRHPNELSGGQLQRVSIARALITHPSLLVADEPVSMLDASLRMSIVNLFRSLKERQSVLYITHDLATAYYAADRVAIMLRGWIVEHGPVERVLGEPKHPYTQVLKSSVLEPDPSSRNHDRIAVSASETEDFLSGGCRFAGRCPRVMDVCRSTVPRDTVVDGRVVKCHLYANGGMDD